MAVTTAAAIIGGAVLGAGASIYSSSKASDATSEAAEEAANAELEMFYQNREDLAPWRESGENALSTIWSMLEEGPLSATDYEKSADYEFVTSEGETAINRALASRGQYDSGKALKAITEYNQDYALTDYNNYLTNWYNSLSPYLTLAGYGQSATETTTSEASDTADALASIYTYEGSNNASSYLNTGSAISSAADSGVSNYLLYKYLNS